MPMGSVVSEGMQRSQPQAHGAAAWLSSGRPSSETTTLARPETTGRAGRGKAGTEEGTPGTGRGERRRTRPRPRPPATETAAAKRAARPPGPRPGPGSRRTPRARRTPGRRGGAGTSVRRAAAPGASARGHTPAARGPHAGRRTAVGRAAEQQAHADAQAAALHLRIKQIDAAERTRSANWTPPPASPPRPPTPTAPHPRTLHPSLRRTPDRHHAAQGPRQRHRPARQQPHPP